MSAASGSSARAALLARWDELAGGLLLLVFLLLKTYGLRPAASDENIYFYLACRAADGVLPYRDTFFAHPPVHLLPATLLCLLFGPRLLLLKAVAPLAAAGAGLALWRVARARLGRAEGLVTLLLFLFAHDLLRASSHHTGVNLALLLLCAGLLASERGRDGVAGALIAGSALSAFYLAPAGMALALVRLARRRARGLALIASGALTFALVNLLGLLIGGEAYWREVYGYHLMKPAVESALLGAATPVAFRNATLLWSLPLALLLSGAGGAERRDPRPPHPRGQARQRDAAGPWPALRLACSLPRRLLAPLSLPGLCLTGLAMAGATALLLASLGRLYHFYFLAAFPGLALLGGHAYVRAGRRIAGAIRAGGPSEAGSGSDRRVIAGLLALGLVFGALGLRQAALHRLGWYQRQRGEVRTYTWSPSPLLPGPVDAALRALFWSGERRIGAFSTGVTQYLWHESRVFTAGERLADAVDARVPAGGTLFGDSTSAPLVALLSGRRLALDEADTNFMRFRSGVTPIDAFLERIDEAPPAAVVVHPRRGIASIPAFRRWLEERYLPALGVDDPAQGRYLLYLPR